jgi:dihydropteroate synthase
MRPDWRAKRDAFLGKIGARPVIMGILNVTPDSFSDGGRYLTIDAATAQARRLAAEGAGIVDVGAESTRPGATAVDEAEELARIEPVLAALGEIAEVPLSVDTSKANVAKRALALGAVLINDVGGLQRDPAMAEVVAAAEAGIVIMHSRAEKDEAVDILADMRRFFDRSLAIAEAAGIPRQRILLDPGVGFGKTSRQNVQAVAGIALLKDYGLPVLVGLSRKGFLGSLGSRHEATLAGTIAANLAAAAYGASIFRVHDVAEHVAALSVFDTIRRGPG